MYTHGWQNIVNVDYSLNVIEYMKQRCQHMPEMTWKVADIFELNNHFNQEFDCAIDKGTLDALLTEKHDPWNPHSELLERIHHYITQVAHVLKPNGKLLHITFAQPHFRKRFLEIPQFSVQVHPLGGLDGSFEYFCYEATKI